MTARAALRRLGVTVAIVAIAGTAIVPGALAADPAPVQRVTVPGLKVTPRTSHATGHAAPAKPDKARLAWRTRAAADHGADVKGSQASGIRVLNAPTTGDGRATRPTASSRTSPSTNALTPAAEPAADNPTPGMSYTSYALSGSTGSPVAAAASATDVMFGGGDRLAWLSRDTAPDEATTPWLPDFLGLPATEAAWNVTPAWDQRHGRWVVAATTWEYDETTCNEGFLVLAVSAGASPAGAWTRWRIPIGAHAADDLSLGLSDSLIAIGANEFPLDPGWVACLGLPFSGARLRVLDWSDVLDGGGLTVADLTPAAPAIAGRTSSRGTCRSATRPTPVRTCAWSSTATTSRAVAGAMSGPAW